MKIWMSYGSEHSMNLVLVGHFKTAKDADHVEELLDKLEKQAAKDEVHDISRAPAHEHRFSEEMRSLLMANNMFILSPTELDQLVSDYHLDKNDRKITIRTDEPDISAFLKVFLESGARVEVHSAHDYPDNQ